MRKFFLIFAMMFPLIASADLEVHFLDVGHGDCAIIVCDGEAMIVDGGDARQSDKVYSAIRQLGITELKYAFATHPHSDHIGGLPSAFYAATVRSLYTPVASYDSDRFSVLMQKAADMSAPVIVPNAGDTLSLGGAKITIISPHRQYGDPDDMSIFFRLQYGSRSFLFCGDAGETVENDILRKGISIDSDVIKIANHGSRAAASEAFLDAVSPRYAVISCSAETNEPSPELIAALIKKRITLIQTGTNGDITIKTDGTHMTAAADVYYVCNANTGVAHRQSCRYVEMIKPEHISSQFSAEQAEYLSYRPCKRCSPWKTSDAAP